MEWFGKEISELPIVKEPDESHSAWVFTKDRIGSISDEDHAAYLAEDYPEAIYFFAESVTHPNS